MDLEKNWISRSLIQVLALKELLGCITEHLPPMLIPLKMHMSGYQAKSKFKWIKMYGRSSDHTHACLTSMKLRILKKPGRKLQTKLVSPFKK